ncbi:MAG: hypothetical protein NT005_04275 [Spirochaetes bacterium]|jgi:hypothetical protein|nr:hypothetical protein [Spirochaetota bacterium]
MMAKKLALPAAALIFLVLTSCAGSVYTRSWTYESATLTDTLRISGGDFRLERESADGTAVFTGKLTEKGEQWTFVIDSWKPINATIRRLDPPITYIYRVKKFQGAVSFLSMEISGSSTLVFIRPGDFEAR